MKSITNRCLLTMLIMVAPVSLVCAGVPDCAPTPAVCAKPEAPAPQTIVVDVPPPKVIVRHAEPACVSHEGVIKRCCNFLGNKACASAVYSIPATIAQTVAPQMMVQPVAPQVMVQPVAPQVMVQPVAPQVMVQPVAPQMMVQPLVQHMMVQPMAYQPSYQPMAYQPMAYQPMAAPQAPPQTAPPPLAPDSGTDCNKALQRLTAQMETLTKVVDKHTTVLTSHERRIQRLEDYLKKPAKDLQGLELSDKD